MSFRDPTRFPADKSNQRLGTTEDKNRVDQKYFQTWIKKSSRERSGADFLKLQSCEKVGRAMLYESEQFGAVERLLHGNIGLIWLR